MLYLHRLQLVVASQQLMKEFRYKILLQELICSAYSTNAYTNTALLNIVELYAHNLLPSYWYQWQFSQIHI